MIFNDGYDKSLYLILKNNKKNRDEIIDFLKLIPYEFIMKIQESLSEYEKSKFNNGEKVKYFNSEIYTSDGYLYSFSIDNNSGILSIIRSVYQYGAYYKELEIRLCKYDNIDDYSRKNVGAFCCSFNNNINIYNNNNFGKLKEYNYDMMKIPFKNVLLLFVNNRVIGVDNLIHLDNVMIEDVIVNNKKRSLRKD